MKEYDVIIIGSGAGANLVNDALEHNKTVALVDKGPVGGTCLNVGCIPTKLIVYPADRIMEIREAKKLGITAEIKEIDFKAIMDRMRSKVKKSHDRIQEALEKAEGLRFLLRRSALYRRLYARRERHRRSRAKRSSSFPAPGLSSLPSRASTTSRTLRTRARSSSRERPESMIIIGGGYIAAEFAHFFEAVGTKVTIIQRNQRLVPDEEPEIADLLQAALSRRMTVHTDTEAVEVRRNGGTITVMARERGGKTMELAAQTLLIAAGRKSNADLLQVEKTGVKTNERGYIVVDDYFETTKNNIWSFGDAHRQEDVPPFRERGGGACLAQCHTREKVAHQLSHGAACRVLLSRDRLGGADRRAGGQAHGQDRNYW